MLADGFGFLIPPPLPGTRDNDRDSSLSVDRLVFAPPTKTRSFLNVGWQSEPVMLLGSVSRFSCLFLL